MLRAIVSRKSSRLAERLAAILRYLLYTLAGHVKLQRCLSLRLAGCEVREDLSPSRFEGV